MANKRTLTRAEKLEILRSDLGLNPFGYKGHLGEAYRAAAPILQAWRDADASKLPERMSQTYRKQAESGISQLRKVGLRRVIRIMDPTLVSAQKNGNSGFTRWVDASREWRECEVMATVLEQYVDRETDRVVMENYDPTAILTIRQSRHIRMADQRQKKKKNQYYEEKRYNCPSCGAEVEQSSNQSTCPYCGAVLRFNFFDWQLESFYLDMQLNSILNDPDQEEKSWLSKKKDAFRHTAKQAGRTTRRGLTFLLEKLLDGLLMLSTESAIAAVVSILVLIPVSYFMLPLPLRIVVLVFVVLFAGRGIYRLLRSVIGNAIQKHRKKGIVRYSDGYLRSCIYDEVWQTVNTDHLIDFSLDTILLDAVRHTEETTQIKISTTVIEKIITEERTIQLNVSDCRMALQRSR